MDNSAIERIAAPDLTSDALALLEKYRANDDVMFFLGRLVWKGEMASCAPALLEIAIDPSRDRYARIAAICGVLAVGEVAPKEKLWETIAEHPGPLDRAVLAEILDWAPPTMHSIPLLLRSLEHVAPYTQFSSSGLEHSLHKFIDRLPVMVDDADEHPLGHLVEGLNSFLEREPFVERGECHVSEKFAWLMPLALHAVDQLVAARSAQALMPDAISVLRNMPALRFWRDSDVEDYKTSLSQNVPRWRELNDLLYWTNITACRARMAEKSQSVLDDGQIAYIGHFWEFGPEDFERCLEWVRSKGGDDRFVALSRCIQIYVEADRPSAWLAPLRAVVSNDEKLKIGLEARLDPKPSPAMEKMEAEHRRWERESEARDRKEKKNRTDWVRVLKENPDRLLHPADLKPGEFSNDQYYLLETIMSGGSSTTRENGANWRALIPEFGEAVARAFRDAAIAHWRAYRPALRSEGAATGSTPYSLIFAMTGLAIEAGEDSAFAQRLSENEARLAFRYVTWELNGFPVWFESLYRAFPDIGRDAVVKELAWELEYTVAENPSQYVLHDILYFAPWLHSDVAPHILDWLRSHDMPNAIGLRYCQNILAGGGTASEELAALAAERANSTALVEQRPSWYALWADTEPGAAIPELDALLQALSPKDASAFAQQFIVELLGDRHGTGVRVGAFRNAQHLKMLYILMHRHIRVVDDIDRTGKGAYSPTLRDNSQDARNTLFKMLVEVPGAEAYAAIKSLEQDHPEPNYRRWMAVRARHRATMDADEPLWSPEQVHAFARASSST